MKRLYPYLLAFLLLAGCEEPNPEPGNPDHADKKANEWILSTLQNWYYWYGTIPSGKSLNQDYDIYFDQLLSPLDGKDYSDGTHYFYSYILRDTETKSISADLTGDTHGMEFTLVQVSSRSGGPNKVVARILYVIRDSPAWQVGIRRGDWIGSVDGVEMTMNNYKTLYPRLISGTNVKVNRLTYVPQTADSGVLDPRDAVTVSSIQLADDPVFFDTVIVRGTHNIGYLVYNFFETGTDADVNAYDNRLKEVFAGFAEQHVNDLVLDLRYNPGGYLSSCQLLSSMIAPESALGARTFIRMEYNNKHTDRSGNVRFMSVANMTTYGSVAGVNLNLPRLYVIATYDSASASEAVMNGLRGLSGFTVWHIGSQTEGKNMGSQEFTFTDNGYDYEMHPLVMKLYNGDGLLKDYSDGLRPDKELYEDDHPEPWKEFGDPDELFLAEAISHITTGSFTSRTKAAAGPSLDAQRVGVSSLDRHPLRGAINNLPR